MTLVRLLPLVLFVLSANAFAQLAAEKSLKAEFVSDHLPPLPAWSGASEQLQKDAKHPWVTPAEESHFKTSPNYQDSLHFLEKLIKSSPLFALETIGTSPQGRAIVMVKAGKNLPSLGRDDKPTLLVQAGIHSGEIDGKDAGLMLLRDIAHGNKEALLNEVNLLFIPILSVDGHERRSAFNRMNQRGPELMGWRSTAQNLNLNRDYAKAEAPEMQALIGVITKYNPDLYLDIHVTDGEDYQYDITFGFNEPAHALSPNSASFLASVYRPALNRALTSAGHLPGPLVFARDSLNFAKGIQGAHFTPRFSNGYGDARHLPTVLVENHSLKPYRQRVLGTYVLVEHSLKLLAEQGKVLKLAKKADENARPSRIALSYKTSDTPELIRFLGVKSIAQVDEITGLRYQSWTGEPLDYDALPQYWETVPNVEADLPKAFWLLPEQGSVIEKLALHGIHMTRLENAKTLTLQHLVAKEWQFAQKPMEGRFRVQGDFSQSWQTQLLPKGAVRISTDQALGRLAATLLLPSGPDSFFQWGYFYSMFERSEYFEPYAIVPLIAKENEKNSQLKKEFAEALKQDKQLASSPEAKVNWWYQRLPYFDAKYLHYPVLLEW